jgi:hypothetical protein
MIEKRQITVAKIGAAMALAGLFACGFVAPSQAATAGWQSPFLFSVATGTVNQFFSYNCPGAFPVAQNGAFEMNSVGQSSQVYVAYNGPRYDENPPAYNVWGFHFYWPNGAPAGVTINFNAMCEIRESI